jgi:hypothetical protein
MRIEEMYLLDVINDNYYGVLSLYIDNFCIPSYSRSDIVITLNPLSYRNPTSGSHIQGYINRSVAIA